MRVETEIRDKIAILSINNPPVNVLDLETRKELLEQLKKLENEKIKCVVITAKGEVFSAGADLKHLLSLSSKSEAEEYSRFVRSFLEYVENYPKPTIGAVNGTAVGGGLELLLCLDIVIASENAKFGQTELNVGLIPGGGGTQRLPRIVGIRGAKKMIFTGEIITAKEAYEIGLVNEVVKKESLLDEALNIGKKICEKSLTSLQYAKRAINACFSQNGFELESSLYQSILLSDDGKEGIKAFLEKRKPVYDD
jgi:enoyl-CoA hydratase